MKWFKRYLRSCLVAVVFFAAFDAYRQPHEAPHLATILVASAVWPVFTAVVMGAAIGDIVHDATAGKAG